METSPTNTINHASITPVRCDAKPTVEHFVAALNAGSDSWVKAGEILVALRNEQPTIFNKICHDYPFVTQDILDVFYQIGIHTLNPMALLLPRHAFNAVRQMRYDAQSRVLSEPIEIVTRIVGDKPVVIRKGVAKLTPDECRRALYRRGVIPVSKQVDRMKTPPAPAFKAKATPPPLVVRTPKEVARFAVSRGVAGTWRFERTMARSVFEQSVTLEHGQSIIVLTEYDDKN